LVQDPSPSEDFDSAKSIVDKLGSLSRDRQERILRWVAESLGLALSGSPPAVPGLPPAILTPTSVPPGAAKDIKSFIAEKLPKSDNQFAAAVAYYYRFEAPPADRKDAIDGDLLQVAARQAGWRRPKRPTDTLNNALKAGYLDSAERGRFKLNNVGENLVAMAMPSGSAASAIRKKGKRKPGKKKKKATPKGG
jgi:hypothetical protein